VVGGAPLSGAGCAAGSGQPPLRCLLEVVGGHRGHVCHVRDGRTVIAGPTPPGQDYGVRLISHHNDGAVRAGLLVEETVVDTTAAAAEAGIDAPVATVRSVLALSPDDRIRLGAAAAELEGTPLSLVRLAPPVHDPQKILCIGLNYPQHASEAAREKPDVPIVFAKFPTSLIGHGEPIELPRTNPDMVDWEGELAFVIGRRARCVEEVEALGYVGGFMPFNDVSGRDLQLASSQWTMAKAFDTSGPCGPALVCVDEVEDPHQLRLRTILNGEVVQEASTGEMIFSIARLISYISSLITLEVGDIIATGTPSGVGYARDPQRFLAAGDEIEVEIDGLGRLSNTVKERT
jgi:2-keto-4-pentenoate hydratase/2-oxohepta-3-ene-1,7-dioic acid hydratase in catechol pathway